MPVLKGPPPPPPESLIAGCWTHRPVWEDPGDDALEVDIAAINRLRKLRTTDEEAMISGIGAGSNPDI